MNKLTKLGAVFALSLAVPGVVQAQQDHGHGAQPPGFLPAPIGSQVAPTASTGGHMMQDMMQMMMQMHSGAAASIERMGPGTMPGASMMDGEMMMMMMGPGGMLPASPEQGRTTMLARLSEFDSDSDGRLSLAEFEALHAAMIRESTVDRFQHLDADGDGQITQTEMGAPARRMEMQRMSPGRGPTGAVPPGGGN